MKLALSSQLQAVQIFYRWCSVAHFVSFLSYYFSTYSRWVVVKKKIILYRKKQWIDFCVYYFHVGIYSKNSWLFIFELCRSLILDDFQLDKLLCHGKSVYVVVGGSMAFTMLFILVLLLIRSSEYESTKYVCY